MSDHRSLVFTDPTRIMALPASAERTSTPIALFVVTTNVEGGGLIDFGWDH